MAKHWKHYLGRVVDRFVMPLIPSSYRLALQYYKQVLLLGWEPEILHIKDYARESEMAIDVGANMGLYSYAMVTSGMFKNVLAFEPNPTLTTDLQRAGFTNVTVIHKAISSIAGVSQLKITKQGKLMLSGWASLENQIDIDTNDFQQFLVDTIRLDDLKLDGVGFIKIDVEGHELNVLEGARDLFSRNHPACLIECRERNRHQVEAFFSSLCIGYHRIDTIGRYGFKLSPGNILFSTK